MEQLFYALITMALGVAGCAGYFYGTNWLLDAIFPFKQGDGPVAVRNQRITSVIRPWLFLGPAMLALGVYLVYPVVDSFRLSLFDRTGTNFVGVSNYTWMFADGEFRESMFNNMLWLIVVPALSTFFGLVIAALTDRIW